MFNLYLHEKRSQEEELRSSIEIQRENRTKSLRSKYLPLSTNLINIGSSKPKYGSEVQAASWRIYSTRKPQYFAVEMSNRLISRFCR